jgi:hypothetical protein
MKKTINKNYYLIPILTLLFCYIAILAKSNGDFKVFLEAANLLRNGKNMYHVWIATAPEVSGLYFYSPLFALLLVPFTYLPSYIPNLLWLLASAFWVYRIWQLLKKDFDLTTFSKKEKRLLVSLSFLFIIRFLLYNFGLIQMTVFMLWAILESINLFDKNKDTKGSALLALAINIKLLPIVILPYLFYRNKIKPFFLTLFFIIFFLFLPALFLGKELNSFLLHEWWSVINPAQEGFQFEADWGVHSLTALIPTLLMITEGELTLKRNILNLSPDTVSAISFAVRFVFIVFVLYFLGIKKKVTTLQKNWEIAYLTLVIPLIFPHQQKYAFFMLLPAIAYLLYFLMRIRKNNYTNLSKRKWNLILTLILLAFMLMTLSTDGIIGRYYNNISQHYKTITYGAILIAVALGISNPKYIELKETIR